MLSNFQLLISFIINLTTTSTRCQGFFHYFYILKAKCQRYIRRWIIIKIIATCDKIYIIIILHYAGICLYLSFCPGGLMIASTAESSIVEWILRWICRRTADDGGPCFVMAAHHIRTRRSASLHMVYFCFRIGRSGFSREIYPLGFFAKDPPVCHPTPVGAALAAIVISQDLSLHPLPSSLFPLPSSLFPLPYSLSFRGSGGD